MTSQRPDTDIQRFGCVLFQVLLLTLPGWSRDMPIPSREQTPDLQHQASVTLKLVQVFVTDRDGNPVTDLRLEDFTLYDSGRKRIITDFERHVPPPRHQTAAQTSEQTMGLPHLNRKFFLLLDVAGTDDVAVIKAKRTALHFLDTQLLATDEVAVLSFTPTSGLNLHTYLTQDKDKARDAVNNVQEVPPGKTPVGLTLEKERARAERAAGLSPESGATEALGAVSRFREPPLAMKIRTAVSLPIEVPELAKALNYLPGYKHIILFSGGGHRRLLPLYERMGRELASANCLVYAVNSMGQRANFLGYDFIGTDNLKSLASLSGGAYFEDIDRYQSIASEIHNATANYYVLGYTIDNRWDGSYHDIKVKVNRDSCVVHAQAGYLNPKPFKQFTDLEKQLHLIDLALSPSPYHQEPVRFPLRPLACSRSGETHVILLSGIPVKRIQQELTGRAELLTLIYDTDNALTFSTRGEMMFDALSERTLVQYSVTALPPGEYQCRVVIRDLSSGRAAVGSAALRIISSPSPQSLRMDPPLLLLRDTETQFLRLSAEASPEESSLGLLDFFPFLRGQCRPVFEDLPSGARILQALIRIETKPHSEPDPHLDVRIKDRTGNRSLPIPFSILDSLSRENMDYLLLELRLPEIDQGRYTLEIIARDRASGQVTTTNQPLRIH
jgi:VWFA-related protein